MKSLLREKCINRPLVCVYTRTRVYVYTHKHVLKTQTLNSATSELKRGKQKKP